MLITSVSIFFIGPSNLFLPDETYLMFIGLGCVGIGIAGIFAPSIPEIIHSVHDELNARKLATGKKPDEKPSAQLSDKGSAIQNMSFAFGAFLAPIAGGVIEDASGFRVSSDVFGFAALGVFVFYMVASFACIGKGKVTAQSIAYAETTK